MLLLDGAGRAVFLIEGRGKGTCLVDAVEESRYLGKR